MLCFKNLLACTFAGPLLMLACTLAHWKMVWEGQHPSSKQRPAVPRPIDWSVALGKVA